MARGGWASRRVSATRTATARSRCARCRPIPRASWSRTPRRASPEWAELLAERSGGNPFFLEEAIRDLIERGALRRRNGGWQLAVDVDELAIPAAVRGTLRLDRLDRQTRETLLAAVTGRTFGLPLLERLVPRDELMQALTELQRLDLVEKRRRPRYRFRHGLVQEVAYASLVDSKRRKLHKRVGEALKDIYQESPEETYGLLARHFTEADEPEKAVEYLLKAEMPRGRSMPTRRRSSTTGMRAPSWPHRRRAPRP